MITNFFKRKLFGQFKRRTKPITLKEKIMLVTFGAGAVIWLVVMIYRDHPWLFTSGTT